MADSSEIDGALVSKLLADATLTALLPDGWYFNQARAGAQRFGIVSLIDEHDQAVFQARGLEVARYLVKAVVLTSTGGDIKAAAKQIDTLLDGGALTATGYAAMTMARESRVRMTEVDEVDASIRWQHRGGEYGVMASPQPLLIGVYPGAFNPAATTNQLLTVSLWFDAPLMMTGTAPVTVVAVSSNLGLHASVTLTLDVPNSALVADESLWIYGKGQLTFSAVADLTGCSGMTFTFSSLSARSGWSQVCDLSGAAIGDTLLSFVKVITVA